MSITLTGTNGLFTRLGLLGGWVNSILNSQGEATLTAPSKSAGVGYTDLLAQFTSGSAQADIFDKFYNDNIAAFRVKPTVLSNLRTFAQNLLVRQVNDDTVLKGYTVTYALQELIRQMAAGSYKVTACAVAATTPSAGGGNTGTALCTSSKIGPLLPGGAVGVTGTNAMDLPFILPETVTVRCTKDAYTGGATAYSEEFSVLGQSALVTDPQVYNFTSKFGAAANNGSGASKTINVCDAAKYQGSGSGVNLLRNGDFKNYTSDIPDGWTVVAGTATTDFTQSAGSGIVSSTPALKLNATSTAVTLTQQFGSAGGTTSTLKPNTVYAFNLSVKKDAGATGTITVDLIDGTPSTINDNNAVANTLAFTLANCGTSYTAGTAVKYGYFRTPATLPTTYKIRISTSAAAVATAAAYVCNFALREATQIYDGGPYVALFSAATQSLVNDYYTCPFTNDYGNLTNKFGFQWLFNLWFDMRTLGLILPSVGTTAISDSSLIV